MRTLSFILAFGFAFAAPGVNATAESSLPGAGTFTYSGAQLETITTVAHLTLTLCGKQLPTNAQGSASNVARG